MEAFECIFFTSDRRADPAALVAFLRSERPIRYAQGMLLFHRCFLPLALILTAPLAASAQSEREEVWIVRPGDHLTRIARENEVTVASLMRWNDLENDRIRVGQELIIRRGGALAATEQPAPPRTDGPVHKVKAGENLGRIARRYGKSLEEILRWNPEIDPNRIRVGQAIRIPETRRRIEHTVRRGESIHEIAERYEIEAREIRLWNARATTAPLRMGETLVIFSDAPESRSESIGLPYRGSLENPVKLRPHPGFVIRDLKRAYGTEETIDWLLEAFDAVVDRHGAKPKVRVHDISNPKGGFMRGHASHQSGRDVDLSLYRKRCSGGVCPFTPVSADQLDVERQWTLLRHMLERGRVEAIFLDYSLQKPLYEEAKRRGATEAQLRQWFQYPRGPSNPHGLIRHYRNHRDHAHIRFVCPKTDKECVGR